MSDRIRLSETLTKVTVDLKTAKHKQDAYLYNLKAAIKPISRHYNEIVMSGLPKMKVAYEKKKAEKETIDIKNGQALYKVQDEIDKLEHVYRVGIVELESTRKQLQDLRTHASKVMRYNISSTI
jgi:hypothetical protein